MDNSYAKKQELQQLQSRQQDINKRLLELQKILSSHEVLKEFDRHVFECIIDKYLSEKRKTMERLTPYKLKFIYKTGVENEVALSQSFSFDNSCSHGVDDCGIISP